MNPTFLKQIDATIDRGGTLWSELEGASIFLTGGTGFFGRWLLPALARAHERLGVRFEVTALSRNPDAFLAQTPEVANSPVIRFHKGDIETFAFPEQRFTHVVHGAATPARSTFDKSDDALTKFDMTFIGGRRVLDLAVASGAGKFLLISSGSVYGGFADQKPIREDFLGAPHTMDIVSASGHGKRASEALTACYADRHKLDFCVARCFAFVGGYLPLDIHYAIGNFIRAALYEDRIVIKGDGTPLRSYLFAGDTVIWLTRMILSGGGGRIYNVGSDRHVSMRDLAHLIRDILSPGKPVDVLGTPTGAPPNFYVPDIAKARLDLGLDVWTELEESIRLTADVIRSAEC